MGIVLFNDTSTNPHIGCQAVSDAQNAYFTRTGRTVMDRYYNTELTHHTQGLTEKDILDSITSSPIVAALENSAEVIVNGEGTIHHGRGLSLIGVLEVARQMGKPVSLINALIEEVPVFHETLAKLDNLTVRDLASSRYLEGLGIPHRLLPDSIVDARFSDKGLYSFDGRILVTDWHGHVSGTTGYTLNEFLKHSASPTSYYPLERPDAHSRWKQALAEFKTAACIVTARHHGAYLAAMAGRPFVILASNSHKMKGFVEFTGMDIPFCESPSDVEAGIRVAMSKPQMFVELQQWLMSQAPLNYQDNGTKSPKVTVSPRHHLTDRLASALSESRSWPVAVQLCIDLVVHGEDAKTVEASLLQLAETDKYVEPIRRLLKRIRERFPGNAAFALLAARVLTSTQNLDQALTDAQRAAALDPDNPEAQYCCGKLSFKRRQYTMACYYLTEATRLSEDHEEALEALVACLKKLSRYDESVEASQYLNRIRPDNFEYRYQLGHAQYRAGQHRSALASFEECIGLHPKKAHRNAAYYAGEIRVHLGDYRGGFALVDSSTPKAQYPILHPPIGLKLWDGRAPISAPLVVWADENLGVGEELLYASIVPDLIRNVQKCHLVVDSRLVGMLSRSLPHANVIPRPSEPSDALKNIQKATHYLPLRSLARLYRKDPRDFEREGAFIKANSQLVTRCNSKYSKRPRKIGISWRTTNPRTGRRRSIKLSQMLSAFSESNAQLISLQYGDIASEIEQAHAAGNDIFVDDQVDAQKDLEALMAQIQSVDLVVSIDNSTVHMAGSLNKECWCLQPVPAFWCWPELGR